MKAWIWVGLMGVAMGPGWLAAQTTPTSDHSSSQDVLLQHDASQGGAMQEDEGQEVVPSDPTNRFYMSQRGRPRNAHDFEVWMAQRGIRIAKGRRDGSVPLGVSSAPPSLSWGGGMETANSSAEVLPPPTAEELAQQRALHDAYVAQQRAQEAALRERHAQGAIVPFSPP